jgi:hypothetical protein
LLTVPVLPLAARVSLLAPVPRSTAIAVVSALSSVMVSLPVPPVSVCTLATLAEFVPLPRVSVSPPPPRSMLALAIVPVSTMVSAPAPEVSVSTVLKVAVFAALPR